MDGKHDVKRQETERVQAEISALRDREIKFYESIENLLHTHHCSVPGVEHASEILPYVIVRLRKEWCRKKAALKASEKPSRRPIQ